MPLFHSHHPRLHSSTTTTFLFAATNHRRTAMSFSSSPSPSSPSSTQQQDSDQNQSLLTQVLKYHNQTKHSFTNFARGPHGLDWANQPNPFRRYISAPLLPLLHLPPPDSAASSTGEPPLYHSVFSSLPNPKPLSKSTISQFLYDSLALSAWKSTGFSTWSLRVNPSSGNLHPTESYVISPPIDSFANSAFVAHYAPKEHALEVRTQIPPNFFPSFFPEGSFLVGFSSIFWREAWKYGERAFRYCNHDVGHAIGAVSMAAAGLGWDVKILDGLGFRDLEKLLGLESHPELKIPSRPVKGKFPELEFEHPDCVLLVFPHGIGEFDVNYKGLSLAISEFSNLDWKGKPNSLSKEHVCWDIIYRTAEAVQKPLTDENKFTIDPFQSSKLFSENSYKGLTLREIVRKRRSAVDMDCITSIERETFYQIMLHCVPSGSGSCKQKKQLGLPYRALSWEAEVHFALFVHRVVGLPKGLYFLVRNEEQFEDLKKSTRSEFKWAKPEGCPDELPLYELARIDCRELSKRLSCTQGVVHGSGSNARRWCQFVPDWMIPAILSGQKDIASDGCFSLGMVTRLGPTLKEKGVWMYPRLYWETGILGQVLYLEAHAVGISATGIGCFFDDPVHEVLGLRGSNYQSLYHFTVGGPVLDKRIMSLPAYPGPTDDA